MKKLTVKLNNAVEINGKKIKTIELREPMAGELRGLSLLKVVELDIAAITILAPRISELTEMHMLNMGAADLLTVSAGIVSFFGATE